MEASNTKIRVNAPAMRSPRRAQSRQTKKLTIAIFVGVALGVITLAMPVFLKRPEVTVTESLSEPLPTGTIAESDREFCKRLGFDDNGRVFQDLVPCDGESADDARGQPVPAGMMRRLDAISKSFSGH